MIDPELASQSERAAKPKPHALTIGGTMMDNYLWARYQREEHQRTLDELACRPRFDRREHPTRSPLWQRLLRRSARPVLTRGAVRDVTIRRASEADAAQLAKLAAVSERVMPDGPFLLAEVADEVVAAVPLTGGPTLHDITRPTADVVQLLALRSDQLRRTPHAA